MRTTGSLDPDLFWPDTQVEVEAGLQQQVLHIIGVDGEVEVQRVSEQLVGFLITLPEDAGHSNISRERCSGDHLAILSPSFADVQQVSHHPEQQLGGADGAVIVGRHLVPDEVLALFGRQLFTFAEGIDVDKVKDVFTPAVINLNQSIYFKQKIVTKQASAFSVFQLSSRMNPVCYI